MIEPLFDGLISRLFDFFNRTGGIDYDITGGEALGQFMEGFSNLGMEGELL